MRFKGCLFEANGCYGSKVDRHFDVEWTDEAVAEVFEYESPPEKTQQTLWAAATYKEGANRGNAGIVANHALILDKDFADIGDMDATLAHLQVQGLAYIAYTSWSHLKAEKYHPGTQKSGPFECFRVVIPLSRDVTPEEYRSIVDGVFGFEVLPDSPTYAAEIAGRQLTLPSGRTRQATPRGWDPCSNRPTQAYFVPTPWADLEVVSGLPINADAVLRRAQTPRIKKYVDRPYVQPDMCAVSALSDFDRALRSHGFGLGRPGFSGWCRSRCPSCEDPSPSLTVRANGEGVDMRCHAGCRRHEVLSAVNLHEHDLLRKEPGALKVLFEQQLARQVPATEGIPVREAVDVLAQDLRDALLTRRATVLKYPAGVGKSFASAKVMAELVRQGHQIVYSTQEHAVANETRNHLPPDIRARSAHYHSPLVQVADQPVCARADELREVVFEFGQSLAGSICPRCPLRVGCAAADAVAARRRQEPNIIFTSHAGIGQVMGEDKGHDKLLIVDEMPGVYKDLRVSRGHLEELAAAPLPSVNLYVAWSVQKLAAAWLEGKEPGDLRIGHDVIGPVMDVIRDARRLRLREHFAPTVDEKDLLKAADALIQLAVLRESGWDIGGFPELLEGVHAMVPDQCHQALLDHNGVLLSATPLMQSLPGFVMRDVPVLDASPVRRVMVLRNDRGSSALTKRWYNDTTGQLERRAETGGFDWPAVDAALTRARQEAKRYPNRRVLFVTFKALADALRAQPVRLGDDIEVAHYGATRGKNDWMEGRPRECSVVYCFGTPRMDMVPTLKQLGLTREAISDAWVDFAAAELTQAEGRLRLPRRTKPCTIVVEGDVAPTTWHSDNVDEINEKDDIEPDVAAVYCALKHLPLNRLPFKFDPYTGVALASPEDIRRVAEISLDILAAQNDDRAKYFDAELSAAIV